MLKIQSLVRMIYDFFTKKWFLTAIVLTLSTNWFFLLRSFGTELNLMDSNNNLKPLFHYLFWPVFSFTLVFTILKTWADNYNQKVKNNGQFVLNLLLDNINASKETKLRRFSEFIEVNHNSKIENPFHHITQPRLQIENILDNFRDTMATIFGINRSDIGISLVYYTSHTNKWEWLCTMNVTNDIPLKDLIQNSNSTLSQIAKGNSSYLFYPDKNVGIQEGRYLPGNTDRMRGNIGSILCKELNLGRNDKHLRAILSITSYGLQFCSKNDNNAISKIENILLPTFEKRLNLELSLLYIKEVIAN